MVHYVEMELIFCYILAFILTFLLNITAHQHNEESNKVLYNYDKFPGSKSFLTYENIKPQLFYKKQKINSTSRKGKHLKNVTVYFKAFGKTFILDLTQNSNLFSASYIEKHHHSSGTHQRKPQFDSHCFYHGDLRDTADSMVALSTCDGIYRGLVSDQHNTYHIEEYHGSHRIYRDTDQIQHLFKCGAQHYPSHVTSFSREQEFFKRNKRSVIRGPYDGNDNTRFVELYLVNDHSTVLNHNSSEIIKRSQDIVNIVSRLYRSLNIYVALVGVEIWESRDRIVITPSPDVTLENFLRYRRERINPFHVNDNAQLITGTKFDDGVVGKAIKGRICTFQYSGGVNYDYDGLTTLATTVAHEMGHSFGMEHDNDSICHCSESKCIMAATSGMTSPTKWSSCSINALRESFEIGMDYCLRNKPAHIYQGPICGNGLVEEGETCDCGLPQDCNNRCCNATTCQLVPQAKCATGRCCNLNSCKFKSVATLCRSPVGECDLAEFCNGTSEYCPDNVYKQNGLVCEDGQSYCYKGECNTHTNQCKLLWGTTGRASDPICYQQLNMHGTHDGNCGYNWTRSYYTRCHREDVMCGLLHCVHLNEKLMFWRDSLAHTMRALFLKRGNTQYVCRSAMLDVGIDMPDPGMVPDGAKCEENKICISQKCVPLVKLPIILCNTSCADHGVCNSNGNCHCDIGYAPPYCDKPGYGGSLDSGQASTEFPNTKLLIGLLAFFLLLLLCIIIFLVFFYRKRIQKMWNNMPSYTCRIPMKPIFTKSANNKQKRPLSVVIDRSPVISSPQNDVTTPILSSSLNRKPSAVVSNSSQHKPLVPKHETQPTPPVKNKPHSKHSSQKKENIEPKVTKFVPENIIFKPDLKPVKPSSTKSKGSSKAYSKQDVPLPPKPVLSPKSEKKSLTESKSAPDSIPLSPKSDRIIKRESFRGAEISAPVLVSTTNRNSDLFDDLPDTGTLTRGTHVSRSPSARGTPPVPPHGKNITVKRSKSDRSQGHRSPIRPSNLATQEEEEASPPKTLSKSVLDRIISPPKPGSTGSLPRSQSPAAKSSFRSISPPSRPLPPEPRIMIPPEPVRDDRPPSTGVYINNPVTIFDEGDLLDDINQYLNIHSTEEKPVTYTNIPDGSKAFNGTSEKDKQGAHKPPSQVTTKPSTQVNTSKGRTDGVLKNTENDSHKPNSVKKSWTPISSVTKDTKPVSKFGRDSKQSGVSRTENNPKPSIGGKSKTDINKPSLSKSGTDSKSPLSNVSKPGDKTHLSRVNSGLKPATPPKTGLARTKSPTGVKPSVTKSASQVSALTAKFSQDKESKTPSATTVSPNRSFSSTKPKPPMKKIHSFNV